MYMLDTNICSYILKNRPPSALSKLESTAPESLCISIITYAELHFGVEKSSSKKINQQVVDTFTGMLEVKIWHKSAAREYAVIRNNLQKRGQIIGNMDLMIAAHCRSLGFTLVTNNESESRRVDNLRIENWV